VIIIDIRTRTKSGDLIHIGTCLGIRVDEHEKTLVFAEPLNMQERFNPNGAVPTDATVKTFTAEIKPYGDRPGAFLLVHPADPVEWIPGWVPAL
jgi:hypothetical protein